MATLVKKRDLGWLPTVVVLAVVLVAGSRLIYLSVQHHAAIARGTAAGVAVGYVGKIEPELQKLGSLAARQAAAASRALANSSTLAPLESVSLPASTFWMTEDDRVLTARSTETTTASGVASEWESAESSRPVPGASILGPMRLGSQWLLASRVPVAAVGPGSQSPQRGWAVAYADLDEMISRSHLARLTDAGYDFELSQVEPRSMRSRMFISSSTDPLLEAV